MSVAAEASAPEESQDRPRRRRRWSTDEKRQIVAETFAPGASVSIVARRHDVNANQVFAWRRRFGAEPQSFVPVVVEAEPTPERRRAPGAMTSAAPEGPPAPSAATIGRMEIVLGCGSRIVVDHTVDAGALARVIEVLGRR